MAAQENGPSSEAVSIAAPGVCSARCRTVHVRLARSLSTVFETGKRTDHPEIHESSGNDKFLADVSFCRGGNSVSVYLRLRHGVFFGAKRFLHLCLPVWRFLRSRR